MIAIVLAEALEMAKKHAKNKFTQMVRSLRSSPY